MKKSALVLALCLTSTAYAGVVSNHPGSICHASKGADASSMQYTPSTIKTSKYSSTGKVSIVCPLTRNTSNSNGAVVYVDIYHNGMVTTTCTAYSYDYLGAVLASSQQSYTGTGFKELSITLAGSGKSNAYSDYAVLCDIPSSNNGTIFGVDLNEY